MNYLELNIDDKHLQKIGDDKIVYRCASAPEALKLLARQTLADASLVNDAGDEEEDAPASTDQTDAFNTELIKTVVVYPTGLKLEEMASNRWFSAIRPVARKMAGVDYEDIRLNHYADELATLLPGDSFTANIGPLQVEAVMVSTLDVEKLAAIRPSPKDSLGATVAAWEKFLKVLFKPLKSPSYEDFESWTGPEFGVMLDFMLMFVGLNTFQADTDLQPITDAELASMGLTVPEPAAAEPDDTPSAKNSGTKKRKGKGGKQGLEPVLTPED